MIGSEAPGRERLETTTKAQIHHQPDSNVSSSVDLLTSPNAAQQEQRTQEHRGCS